MNQKLRREYQKWKGRYLKVFLYIFRVTAKMMEEYDELFRYEQSQARDLEEREKLILKHHRSLNCVLDREPTRRYY